MVPIEEIAEFKHAFPRYDVVNDSVDEVKTYRNTNEQHRMGVLV